MEKLTKEADNKFATKFLFTTTFEVGTDKDPYIKYVKILASDIEEAAQLANEYIAYWDKNVKAYEYGITMLSIDNEKQEVVYKYIDCIYG